MGLLLPSSTPCATGLRVAEVHSTCTHALDHAQLWRLLLSRAWRPSDAPEKNCDGGCLFIMGHDLDLHTLSMMGLVSGASKHPPSCLHAGRRVSVPCLGALSRCRASEMRRAIPTPRRGKRPCYASRTALHHSSVRMAPSSALLTSSSLRLLSLGRPCPRLTERGVTWLKTCTEEN